MKIIKTILCYMAALLVTTSIISLHYTLKMYDEVIEAMFASYERSFHTIAQIKNKEMKQCDLYTSMKKILAAANPNNYNRQTNNCYDQSKHLQAALYEQGIVSSIFINENRNHAWLGLWIEATNGQFVSRTNTLHMIEVRDLKQKVLLADPVKSKAPISTSSFPRLWTLP